LKDWVSGLGGSDSARDLVANKPELRDLNFGYRILARERKEQLRHLSYYEMVNTIFGRIVEPDSADPGLPDCTPTPIRKDHVTIAKPRRRDELVYAETKNFISKLAPEPADAAELRPYPVPVGNPIRLASEAESRNVSVL
jgi:hypothetical protein